jgi:hypothetical protein
MTRRITRDTETLILRTTALLISPLASRPITQLTPHPTSPRVPRRRRLTFLLSQAPASCLTATVLSHNYKLCSIPWSRVTATIPASNNGSEKSAKFA